VSYDQVKRQRQRQLLASMHPGFPIQEPGQSGGPVSFDGGVRAEPRQRSLPWYRSRSPKLPPGWEPAPED
jgi:hypothetical protein